jgi:hypothetical protein
MIVPTLYLVMAMMSWHYGGIYLGYASELIAQGKDKGSSQMREIFHLRFHGYMFRLGISALLIFLSCQTYWLAVELRGRHIMLFLIISFAWLYEGGAKILLRKET